MTITKEGLYMSRKLPFRLQMTYALGQLGSALLLGIVNSYLMYYYIPTMKSGISESIPQVNYLGIFTLIGIITMLGRLTDAVTDPWIATLSDRSKSKRGRRISFMLYSAFPFSLLTVLVFFSPVEGISPINAIYLAIILLLFYFFMTMYVTPHYALLAELGHDSDERVNLSTYISITYLIGLAFASLAPMLWNIFVGMGYSKPVSMRIAFGILAVIAFVFMLIPVFTIDERKYTTSVPSKLKMVESIKATFKNREFRIFAYSSVTYWVAMTLFQSALLFYITVLLDKPENLYSSLFILLGAGAMILHVPVNIMAKKMGNKKLLILGFILYIVTYAFGFSLGKLPISTTLQAYLLVLFACMPSAIFGVVPTVIIADIAEYDANVTGIRREGMFFGTRTFVTKIGQMISMLLFSALLMININGSNEWGIRMTAAVAVVF